MNITQICTNITPITCSTKGFTIPDQHKYINICIYTNSWYLSVKPQDGFGCTLFTQNQLIVSQYHCDCAIKKNQQSDYTCNNSLHKDIFSEMDQVFIMIGWE